MGHHHHLFSKATGLALLGAVLFAMPAVAKTNNGAPAAVPKVFGAAELNARLAALIGQNGQLLRSKNVANVTNPSTGITCVLPTPSSGINVDRIVPSVTVEWGNSFGSDLLAFYRSPEVTNCPSGYIEVRTYNLAGSLSNLVAFTIVVD